ncbi:MAG: hypothetical protein HY007_01140 [Candidatus Sungbacteria bacterium]|nr:hypothetical protein [Candidatus Sungbacteria bacterium]
MKTYMVILFMLGAFFLERVLNVVVAGKAIFLPLSALAFCNLVWRMKFGARVCCALVIGLVMDTVYLIPFGASLLTCVLLAFLCEVFQTFFSNTESRITQSIGAALLILIFFGMVPWWSFVLGTVTS